MTVRPLFWAAALAVLAVQAAPARAAFTIYTTLASYQAALSSTGTDTYTGFLTTIPTPSPIIRSAGAFGYTASVIGPGSNDFFGAGTSGDPWLSTENALDSIVFDTFTGPTVRGIGGNFFTSNIAGAAATGSITVTAMELGGATSVQQLTSTTPTTFLGFVSTTTITSLQVSSVQPESGFLWPTVDNLVLGTITPTGPVPAVPVPSALVLLASGLPVVGLGVRRRLALA